MKTATFGTSCVFGQVITEHTFVGLQTVFFQKMQEDFLAGFQEATLEGGNTAIHQGENFIA